MCYILRAMALERAEVEPRQAEEVQAPSAAERLKGAISVGRSALFEAHSAITDVLGSEIRRRRLARVPYMHVNPGVGIPYERNGVPLQFRVYKMLEQRERIEDLLVDTDGRISKFQPEPGYPHHRIYMPTTLYFDIAPELLEQFDRLEAEQANLEPSEIGRAKLYILRYKDPFNLLDYSKFPDKA